MANDNEIILFGETNFRGVKRRFGIKRGDRRRHMYIIGKTGMGKTTLLENMTIQDIQSGEGVGIVDPHGEYAEKMLDFVPPSRINDVVYFNPSDLANPVAFNVMEDVGPERRHLVSSGLIGVFKKIWPDVWSARMEYLLSNSILALLETPGSTLLGINRMLADKEFRKKVVAATTDPVVKAFWENEYARYTEKFAAEAGAAVQNKIGQFTSNPLIRNIIGQPKSTIDMRKIMDEKKIFIMNLSKGRIGEENSKLLGAMLITRLYLAAMTRVDMPEQDRKDFYLYVDEFQNFATESFASILSEARKYRLDLILAHQYIAQMAEDVRDAVFGNVGSMLTFRVGAADAELLEKEFSPEFTIQDIVNLGFANIYMRLMIDGVASRPFSATTLPPVKTTAESSLQAIIESSRKLYGRDRVKVDQEIMDWQGFGQSRVMEDRGGRSEGRSFSEPRNTPPPSRQPEKLREVLHEVRAGADSPPRQVPLPQNKFNQVSEKPARPSFNNSPRPQNPAFDIQAPRFSNGGSQERSYDRNSSRFSRKPDRRQQPQYSQQRNLDDGVRTFFAPKFKAKENQQQDSKPGSFLSLSALKKKEDHEKGEEVKNENKADAQKPTKKKVDFTDLKKALAESLGVLGADDTKGEKTVVRDNTGMIRPKAAEENGGVLKPGDKITFD